MKTLCSQSKTLLKGRTNIYTQHRTGISTPEAVCKGQMGNQSNGIEPKKNKTHSQHTIMLTAMQQCFLL